MASDQIWPTSEWKFKALSQGTDQIMQHKMISGRLLRYLCTFASRNTAWLGAWMRVFKLFKTIIPTLILITFLSVRQLIIVRFFIFTKKITWMHWHMTWFTSRKVWVTNIQYLVAILAADVKKIIITSPVGTDQPKSTFYLIFTAAMGKCHSIMRTTTPLLQVLKWVSIRLLDPIFPWKKNKPLRGEFTKNVLRITWKYYLPRLKVWFINASMLMIL